MPYLNTVMFQVSQYFSKSHKGSPSATTKGSVQSLLSRDKKKKQRNQSNHCPLPSPFFEHQAGLQRIYAVL